MKRHLACTGGLILALGLLLVGRPAWAVIMRLTPLKEVLGAEHFIFMAKVEKLDPDKPALVLTANEDLKGQIPCRKLPVNMTGDSGCQKEKQSPQLFKRLAVDLPVVVFASKRGAQYTAFVYTNGTWFQMVGRVGDDPKEVRWSLAHGEPYLRRTFKGTTAELRQIVIDGLAGKKDPPEPNPKEEPGFGPEVSQKEEGEKGGKGEGEKDDSSFAFRVSRFTHHAPRATHHASGPLFAVIPTVFVMGPLALLATLFPAVFGGFQRRWLVLLSIISLNSTLYVGYLLLRGYFKDWWWVGLPTLWGFMTGVTLLGAVWSYRRHRRMIASQETEGVLLRSGEVRVLRFLSLLGAGGLLCSLARGVLFTPFWITTVMFWSIIWIGDLYALGLRSFGKRNPNLRPILSTEAVMLGALVFACAGQGAMHLSRPASTEAVRVAWTFEPTDRGQFDSSPLVADNRVYIAASHGSGLGRYGRVYCLDRETRQELWSFDDDGGMRQVFCSPRLAEGRLYIGEGYHQDSHCRLFCLDAETGKKLWEFATESHTESTPCIADGKVYFGAGDDGVYCLDARTGEKVWHFPGPHVDVSPVAEGKRLYAGSGYGNLEVFCLDADTGKPIWRTPVDLSAFGSPVVSGDKVYCGLGNGNLSHSADQPAGAFLCLDAQTGQQLWRYDGVGDAVHVRPVIHAGRAYFGSRDHHLYCVDCKKGGSLIWKRDLGGPVVTTPALSTAPDPCLYAVAVHGKVYSLDPADGNERWTFDTADNAPGKPQMFSSPTVTDFSQDGPSPRRIYFGAGFEDLVTWTARLYCLEERRREP